MSLPAKRSIDQEASPAEQSTLYQNYPYVVVNQNYNISVSPTFGNEVKETQR